jgi:Icc-related predicted phosphoesterase
MRILHTSDNHGKNPSLPSGHFDLFVDSGDFSSHDSKNFTMGYHERHVNKVSEAEFQLGWFNNIRLPLYHSVNATHKIVIKGNHDFLTLPKNDIILTPPTSTLTFDDMKVGILLGSNIIPHGGIEGGWDDEIDENEFWKRIHAIDWDIDILISHQPPQGILDLCHSGERVGSKELTKAIFGSELTETPPYFTKLRLNLFGHIHEAHGIEEHEVNGRKIIFSNACSGYDKPKEGEGFHVLEI